MKKGLFRASLSQEYINQDLIFVGSSKAFVGAIRQHHDEVQTINEKTTFELLYGITDRLGVIVGVPFISRQHSHIHHHHGADVHEAWSFSGLGDAVVTGQYALLLPDEWSSGSLNLAAGIKIPTGITDLKNEQGAVAEVPIQPGSGSFDGMIGFSYRGSLTTVPTLGNQFSTLTVEAGISYEFTGAGEDDWKAGNSLLVHVGSSYQFASRASFLLQLNLKSQEKALPGTTNEPTESTGGVWFFVTPGMSVDFEQGFSLYAQLQLPLYQKVNGIQQTSAFNLKLGVAADVSLL
jgi:hypothetical protein